MEQLIIITTSICGLPFVDSKGLTLLSSDLTRDLNYITAAKKKIASLPFKIASKWTPTFKRVNWFHFVRVHATRNTNSFFK